MQVDDAAVSTGEMTETDRSDPMEPLQSPSQPSQRRRSDRNSTHLSERIRVDSSERGESEATVDSSLLSRRQAPSPQQAYITGSCFSRSKEKQMPVSLGRRVIVPQPPPPPMVLTTQAHPQPMQLQVDELQEMDMPNPPPNIVKQSSPRRADIEMEPAQHKRHIELVYQGRFAPFHLGHLAIVEAAATLIKAAMRPAVVTTWISLVPAKHLPKKGHATDPVLSRYAHGPHRCSMIEAVCSQSEHRIHVIPKEFANAQDMFQHVKLDTPSHIHIYLEGSNIMPKLQDQK
eukprot:950603-Amphidinium_carterae.1